MERVLASLRELITALGLQGRAEKIEAEAKELLVAHDNAVAEESSVGQRPENKALAICYIAANHVLLPDRISYDAMIRAAAATPTWRAEPVPGKNGMTKLVKRFARRICPIEHDPEIVVRDDLSFTVCAQCRYVLHTGGHAKAETDPEDDVAPVQAPRTSGLRGYGPGDGITFDDAVDVEEPPVSKASKTRRDPKPSVTASEVPAATGPPEDDAVEQTDLKDVVEADAGPEVEAGAEPGGDAPFSGITPEIRKKWLASAMLQAKKLSGQMPSIKPAVPGAMALIKRSIDTYITSDKVLGSLVQKVIRMAVLHECKMQNLPVTTKDLNVQPSDYLKFLAAASATVAPVSATSDSALVEKALNIIAAYERKPVDDDTRERIVRFQSVTRRKLMGFSPAMAAAVIAYIDIVRHDPAVVLSKVASISGSNTSSLYNATGRFLEKVGRSGDPTSSLNERVVAAFPPRDK